MYRFKTRTVIKMHLRETAAHTISLAGFFLIRPFLSPKHHFKPKRRYDILGYILNFHAFSVARLHFRLENQGLSEFWDIMTPVAKIWRQVIPERLDEAKCDVVV